MRKLLLLSLLVATAVAAVAYPALAGTRSVSVGNDYFVRDGAPLTVHVSRGSSVKWVWRTGTEHNVTVTSGPVKFRSGTRSGGSYTKRLTRSGTYSIICTIHEPDMRMKLVVR